jgi:DNA-binding CsgD family transcriptional regulator
VSHGGRDKLLPVSDTKGRIDSAALELPMPSEGSLKALFDLTPAEARLAQRLACGDSVEEVAHVLHIKMTTARTQLAAIFAKTETRRQAKLVAILSRIAHLEMAPAGRSAATDSTEPFPPIAGARFAI